MAETRASRIVADWLKSGTPDDPHSQSILAERLSKRVGRNVNQSTVSCIARGQQQPKPDLLAALLDEFGIDPHWWNEKVSGTTLTSEADEQTGTEG